MHSLISSHDAANAASSQAGAAAAAIQPLAYGIAEACIATSLPRASIYKAVRAGQLTLRKSGRRSVILADELRRFVEALPVAG